jgi:hypothetical protein
VEALLKLPSAPDFPALTKLPVVGNTALLAPVLRYESHLTHPVFPGLLFCEQRSALYGQAISLLSGPETIAATQSMREFTHLGEPSLTLPLGFDCVKAQQACSL